MSDWQPNLYLEFGRERTRPSIDLVTRIDVDAPKRIIDIGCGPGNSTAILRARWPQAEIIGLDSSEAMIAEARSKCSTIDWVTADAGGDLSALGSFDIVFSNAAIQWMPDHERLLPKLFGLLNAGGVFAVQVPDTEHMPIHTELARLATSPQWETRFAGMTPPYSTHPASFYFDTLCALTTDIDLWETRYFHIMDTHADIVKWYSGSGLRPYLDCLADQPIRTEFLEAFEASLKRAYPTQANGRVLFPFTRVFFMARG